MMYFISITTCQGSNAMGIWKRNRAWYCFITIISMCSSFSNRTCCITRKGKQIFSNVERSGECLDKGWFYLVYIQSFEGESWHCFSLLPHRAQTVGLFFLYSALPLSLPILSVTTLLEERSFITNKLGYMSQDIAASKCGNLYILTLVFRKGDVPGIISKQLVWIAFERNGC